MTRRAFPARGIYSSVIVDALEELLRVRRGIREAQRSLAERSIAERVQRENDKS